MTSGGQLGIGRVSAVVFAGSSEKEVDFGEYAKYDLKTQEYGGKLSVKIWGGWHVYAKGGKWSPVIESQSAPTVTYENKDSFAGTFVGGGIKWVMFPDTIVTPAVALDVSGTQYASDINKNNIGVAVNDDWKIEAAEIQGAIMVSKKILMFDPYAGIKIFNTDVKWTTTAQVSGVIQEKEISGDANGVAPFAGVKFSPLPFISVNVEASLGAEKNFAGGVSVGF
jgi:hypothetical protein